MIVTGEINIVQSIYLNVWLRQFKYLLIPVTVLLMLEFKCKWSVLFVCITVYLLFSVIFQLKGLISNLKLASSLHLTFYLEILKYLSLSVTFIFISLNAYHYIAYYWVLIILFTNLVVISIRLGMSQFPRTYIDNGFGDFIEAVQFIFIAFKYFDIWSVSWSNTLVFYKCFVYFIAVLGVGSAFLLPFIMGIASFQPEGGLQKMIFNFVTYVLFHVAFKAISFFYIFFAFVNFATSKGFVPGAVMDSDDLALKVALYFMLVCSILNLCLINQQQIYFKKIIAIKLLIISRAKGVKREFVKVPFDMKIVHAGTNYFKKLVSTRKLPDSMDIGQVNRDSSEYSNECMICCMNPSTTLIRPCNHGGFCENCIIQYLGTNTVCPHCKVQIDKVYVMKFDAENGNFLGEKVLSIIK